MPTFLKFARRIDPALVIGVTIFMVFSAFAEVVSVALLRALFMICLGQTVWLTRVLHRVMQYSDSQQNALFAMIAVTFGFIVMKNVALGWAWRSTLRRFAVEQAELATALFESYLRAPFLAHTKRSWSSLQHELNAVTTQIFSRLVVPSLQAASEALVLGFVLAFLLVKAPLSTMLLSLWLAGTLYVFRRRAVKVSRHMGIARDISASQMLQLAHETMSDFKSIKVRACENFFVSVFRDRALKHAANIADDRYMSLLPRFVFEPVLIGGLGVLYLVLIATHARPDVVLANLTLYAAASVRILPAAQRLISQMHVLAFDKSIISKVIAHFEEEGESLPEGRGIGRIRPFETAITIENVYLEYRPGDLVLQNVNLEIATGDRIAIFGRTGSGKTSLLNILMGLVLPSSGRILIDGESLPLLARYRESNIAYIQQDMFLFDADIAANAAFATARQEIDEARVWQALRRAHLDTTVRNFPKGLATRVGENGITLSGGERQRLALARAFYQGPKFLVLDEATSQLDVTTERAILADIFNNDPSITIIAVTHRKSTAELFPRCWLVSNRIVSEISARNVAIIAS